MTEIDLEDLAKVLMQHCWPWTYGDFFSYMCLSVP